MRAHNQSPTKLAPILPSGSGEDPASGVPDLLGRPVRCGAFGSAGISNRLCREYADAKPQPSSHLAPTAYCSG